MKYTKLMPDFTGVAATGTAVCDLTAEVGGKCLESILLELGGGSLTRAMITGWRLLGDGKVLRQGTGTDQNTINLYYGHTSTTAELLLDFMAPWARTPQALCAGAWDLAYQLSRVNRVTLQVDIAGATTPTLKAYAELSDSVEIAAERPYRWVLLREERQQIAITASGDTNVSAYIPNFMPVEGGSVYRAIHFFSANVTHLRVRKNGVDWFDKTPIARLQAFQKRAGRAIQANHLAFDPCLEGMLDRVFDTTNYSKADVDVALTQGQTLPGAGNCKSADIILTMSGAETFWVQTQELLRVTDH